MALCGLNVEKTTKTVDKQTILHAKSLVLLYKNFKAKI